MAGKPNFKNRTLCKGDNLDFLRSINSKTVDLIATDPPFQKGMDFHSTPDSMAAGSGFQDRWFWDEEAQGAWLSMLDNGDENVIHVVEGSRKSYGDDMGAFLCFMAVRLIECRRILKETGSMYLHCDPTASHYLKELMDAIFGRDNFRQELIWKRSSSNAKGSQHASRSYGSNADFLLFYSKTDKYVFHNAYQKLTDAEMKKAFPHIDDKGRRYNTQTPLWCSKSMGARPNLCYDYKGFSAPHQSGWRISKSRLEEMDANGLIIWREGKNPLRKSLASDYKGKPLGNIWIDIPNVSGKVDTGYATQKPLLLYERLIMASSNKGDIVLDPFCGCATTCVAAERLGRQWIGIDLWEDAYDVTIKRLEDEGILAVAGTVRQDVLFTKGEITRQLKPFERTDDMMEGAPYLKAKMRKFDDSKRERNHHTREQMVEIIQDRDGDACQGCGIVLPLRYYELDHINPRSDGGSDLVHNRIFLCAPCNKLKSNNMTISGVRKQNKKEGFMVDELALNDLRSR